MNVDGLDIVLIHQLLARYGHAIDDRDWTAFRELFHPDGVIDYSSARGPNIRNGIDDIMDFFETVDHPAAHHVTNIVVDDRADRAGAVPVRSKFLAPFTRPSNRPTRLYGGEYFDTVSLDADGRWRFASKVCLGRWQYTPSSDDPNVPDHRRTF